MEIPWKIKGHRGSIRGKTGFLSEDDFHLKNHCSSSFNERKDLDTSVAIQTDSVTQTEYLQDKHATSFAYYDKNLCFSTRGFSFRSSRQEEF